IVDLDLSPQENLDRLAQARGVPVGDLVVLILNRPRHEDLISAVRKAGARIRLIQDGDVAGVIATTRPETGIDLYMGIGGAPEGVLAAAALQCTGGQFQGRLNFRNDDEKARARRMGIEDLGKKYAIGELAHGDIFFSATGVTDGWMLRGVHRRGNRVTTESIVMRSRTGTVRVISAERNLDRKTFDLGG
ncbi:MAG: fructose-bisphosphatase class II, partial [Proteobacteria bacterium]|nr:fructose-bisphosphatase class II [Pseudomonadota bacterium]